MLDSTVFPQLFFSCQSGKSSEHVCRGTSKLCTESQMKEHLEANLKLISILQKSEFVLVDNCAITDISTISESFSDTSLLPHLPPTYI